MCIVQGWTLYISLAAATVYTGNHFRSWPRHLFGSALCRKLGRRGEGRLAFCFALFPVWFKSQAIPLLISSNEFTNQYCQQKNHQPCKQAWAPEHFQCLLPFAVRGENQLRSEMQYQLLSFEEQMVLIGLLTMVGYHFQLKAQFFLSVIQFLTMPSLLCCKHEAEQQLQSVCSHDMLNCSRCGIPRPVENGLNYPLYSRFQLFHLCDFFPSYLRLIHQIQF